ncbi:FAD-binding oxidoreductase [Patescibacteria group bacterium]|jgi:ferredoxin-NADP reductase|nr:FAD-binding oxidoreductase [Patescibacteria group bacterium]
MAENPVLKIRPFRVAELTWETADTYTLHLEPQDPADMITFKAGQWVYLHLMNGDGTVWARAAYSIASAPEESGVRVRLGIKLAGDFTKKASKLMPDDVVGIQGPFGVFVLPPGEGPIAIFAAGIGITPFRSMIRSLEATGQTRGVVLFYTNKTVEDTAYLEEFDALAKRAPWFKPVFTLTQDRPSIWPGESGRINGEMLDRHIPNLDGYTFMTCGPKSFMEAIKFMLEERGVDTRARLKQELFG